MRFPALPLFALGALPLAAGLGMGSEDESATGARIGRAFSTIEAPAIDGRLDEDVWAAAEPLTDFIQAEPFEGQPATERTEVRILFDDEAVYIGAMLYDSDPAGIIATDARRDSNLQDTDSFRVVFDTYHDLQNGFVFGTTPAGLEYDGQLSNAGGGGGGGGGGPQMRARTGSGGGFNVNWDASWTVATQVTDEGWSAEFAIPLRTLRYGSSPQTWGINFHRNIRRKREEDYWSPVARIYDLYRLSSAGELHGLELRSPRNFKVTPYALSAAGRDYAVEVEAQTNTDFGVDAKVGITPSLNVDLTYNTDFAQVEVDDQQINLSRFNLFFPEKRPFFLENAGNFSMGQGSSVDLFFSRRIGIGPDGTPVPILGGARLSGKAGRLQPRLPEHADPGSRRRGRGEQLLGHEPEPRVRRAILARHHVRQPDGHQRTRLRGRLEPHLGQWTAGSASARPSPSPATRRAPRHPGTNCSTAGNTPTWPAESTSAGTSASGSA